MRSRKELFVIFTISYFIPAVISGEGCQKIKCKEIWYDGQPRKEIAFYIYENSTTSDVSSTIHWQWATSLYEKWTVYYKEWPRKTGVSGGFVLLNKQTIVTKLSWKINNNILQWTTMFRRPFSAKWNGTICNRNIPIKMESLNRSWIFYLGGEKIIGGKSGQKKLDDNSSLLNSLTNGESLNRTIREAEDMAGKPDKDTVWNKIKGWFKELFDQSENDNRGWLSRLGDWMLGFLERVLT